MWQFETEMEEGINLDLNNMIAWAMEPNND